MDTAAIDFEGTTCHVINNQPYKVITR